MTRQTANYPIGSALFIAALLASHPALADTPRVHFDAPELVACRELPPDEAAATAPDEKLVEATIEISSLAHGGETRDLTEFVYHFQFPDGIARVVRYTPQTTLETDVVGNVSIERKDETSATAGLSAGGRFAEFIDGSATASLGKKTADAVRFDRLPPKHQVAASGTTTRGGGVYFKLRRWSQNSLEGAKTFTVVLSVPRDWRADWMRVQCRAVAANRGLARTLEDRVACGGGEFVVGLYAAGDGEAQQAVAQLVDAHRQLRRLAASQWERIERRSLPTPAHRFGALLSVVEPRVPADWLARTTVAPTASLTDRYDRYLPQMVRAAAVAYREARQGVYRLTGANAETRA